MANKHEHTMLGIPHASIVMTPAKKTRSTEDNMSQYIYYYKPIHKKAMLIFSIENSLHHT